MSTIPSDALAQLERRTATFIHDMVLRSALASTDDDDHERHSELGDVAGLLECPC